MDNFHPNANDKEAVKKLTSFKLEDQTENVSKIRNIINEQFDRELADRQRRLVECENQITASRKLLHLIRYAGTCSYYRKPELEHSQDDSLQDIHEAITQKRLHPALKKIINENTALSIFGNKKKRKAHYASPFAKKKNLSSCAQPTEEENQSSILYESSESTAPFDQINHESEQPINSEVAFDGDQMIASGRRNRKKYTIIVGNISTWMPPDPDPGSHSSNESFTHKWMAYIRGPKDAPQVSHFIKKVIFHLHPSFKPYDVFEIRKPPFHLKKIGWGEFPLKVKIYFKCPLNKPVDIIHNLKLPKIFPGKQVTANETIVDLYLQEELPNVKVPQDKSTTNDPNFLSQLECEIKTEPRDILSEDFEIFEPFSDNSSFEPLKESLKGEEVDIEVLELPVAFNEIKSENNSEEHDYCYLDSSETSTSLSDSPVKNNSAVFLDHCYIQLEHKNTTSETIVSNESNAIQNRDTNLIYGLGDDYHKTPPLKNDIWNIYRPGRPVNVLEDPQKYKPSNNLDTDLKKTKPVLKKTDPLFKKVLQKHIKQQIKIVSSETGKSARPINKSVIFSASNENSLFHDATNVKSEHEHSFRSVGEALPYLFRKVLLYQNGTNEKKYSFTATSFTEFCLWNIGKQLNAERSRAKTILHKLKTMKPFGYEEWNIRAIIMYGRSHAYMPKISINEYSIFNKNLPELKLLNNCYISKDSKNKFTIDGRKTEMEIDVVADKESKDENRTSYIDISDSKVKQDCAFVRQCALDVGIVLKHEEVDNGIVFNGSERMIFEAVKSLINNLVRRGRHHLIAKGNFREDSSVIDKEDVLLAIKERPEIKSIMEYGQNRRNIEYYS